MNDTRPPTLVCTEAGVFAWPGYALVERQGARCVRASERDIGHLVGSLCGASVIYGPLIPMLDRAARFLERGELAKAQASIACLRMPPRSPEIEKLHLAGALDRLPFAKLFNPDLHPRWPAGRSDGGQFRPVDRDPGRGVSEASHAAANVAVRDKRSECNDRCYQLLERSLPYKFSNLNEFAFRRCFNECMEESG